MKVISLLLRVLASVIMLQTLYFKFTAHPSSVALFTQLGLEPYGRIGIGIAELIASVLILYPKTIAFGSLIGLGLMTGAIFSHFLFLGIEVDGDNILFIYAVIVWVCCLLLTYIYKKDFFNFLKKI
ncbi:MAG: DoxX family protein, partial [Chitinophagaceae bacterium]|nr:DoxX family protein [Chitinophagaceae bacterium]